MLKEQSGCEDVKNDGPGNDFVHFPRRRCTCNSGYNGWRISAEEMNVIELLRILHLFSTIEIYRNIILGVEIGWNIFVINLKWESLNGIRA